MKVYFLGELSPWSPEAFLVVTGCRNCPNKSFIINDKAMIFPWRRYSVTLNNNNNNVRLSGAHQLPERLHDYILT